VHYAWITPALAFLGIAAAIIAALCLFANKQMHKRDVVTLKSVLDDLDACYREATPENALGSASYTVGPAGTLGTPAPTWWSTTVLGAPFHSLSFESGHVGGGGGDSVYSRRGLAAGPAQHERQTVSDSGGTAAACAASARHQAAGDAPPSPSAARAQSRSSVSVSAPAVTGAGVYPVAGAPSSRDSRTMQLRMANPGMDKYVAPHISEFTAASIPDLTSATADTDGSLTSFILNSMFRAALPEHRPRFFNYLRRSQAAFTEYELARDKSYAFLVDRRTFVRNYLAAVSHWRTCSLGPTRRDFLRTLATRRSSRPTTGRRRSG
jgi:hypothetical protein